MERNADARRFSLGSVVSFWLFALCLVLSAVFAFGEYFGADSLVIGCYVLIPVSLVFLVLSGALAIIWDSKRKDEGPKNLPH